MSGDQFINLCLVLLSSARALWLFGKNFLEVQCHCIWVFRKVRVKLRYSWILNMQVRNEVYWKIYILSQVLCQCSSSFWECVWYHSVCKIYDNTFSKQHIHAFYDYAESRKCFTLCIWSQPEINPFILCFKMILELNEIILQSLFSCHHKVMSQHLGPLSISVKWIVVSIWFE